MSELKCFSGKICLSDIDKKRIFVSEKTGKKYLDLFGIPTPKSPHNDYMLVQSQTKEQREAKEKSEPIGNIKFLKDKEPDVLREATVEEQNSDDLPF